MLYNENSSTVENQFKDSQALVTLATFAAPRTRFLRPHRASFPCAACRASWARWSCYNPIARRWRRALLASTRV